MFLNAFSRILQAYSEKPALCFEGAIMSYAQLDCESSRVACALAAGGVGRGDIVVIRLPRGFEAVAAMIGVLKAGAALCMVEEGYPQDRIDFIISDTKAKIVIDGGFMCLHCRKTLLRSCRRCSRTILRSSYTPPAPRAIPRASSIRIVRLRCGAG